MYPVLQVHAGSVSVIRQMTWTTGSLTCVGDHSDACMRGLGTPTMSQHNIFDLEKLFFCSRQGSNLRSLDLESDTTN